MPCSHTRYRNIEEKKRQESVARTWVRAISCCGFFSRKSTRFAPLRSEDLCTGISIGIVVVVVVVVVIIIIRHEQNEPLPSKTPKNGHITMPKQASMTSITSGMSAAISFSHPPKVSTLDSKTAPSSSVGKTAEAKARFPQNTALKCEIKCNTAQCRYAQLKERACLHMHCATACVDGRHNPDLRVRCQAQGLRFEGQVLGPRVQGAGSRVWDLGSSA
eukprot:320845-Rhodomonas_salina.5